jgi:hypothetical protein
MLQDMLLVAPRRIGVTEEDHELQVDRLLQANEWAASNFGFIKMLGRLFPVQTYRFEAITKMNASPPTWPLREDTKHTFFYEVVADTLSKWTSHIAKGKRPLPKEGEVYYFVPQVEAQPPPARALAAILSQQDHRAMTPVDVSQQEAMLGRAMHESLQEHPAAATVAIRTAARQAVATGPAAPRVAGAPVQAHTAAATAAQPVSAGPAGAETTAGAPVVGASAPPTQVSDPKTAYFDEMLKFDSSQSKAIRVSLPNPSLFDGDITKIVPSVYATMEDYVVHLTRHALRAEISMAELIHLYFKGAANVWAKQWIERRSQEGMQPYLVTSTKSLAPLLLKELDADFGKQLRSRDRKALEALLHGTYGQGANEAVALYTSRFRMLMQEGGPFTAISQVSYYQQGLKAELRRHCTVDHFGNEFKSLAPLIDYASGMEQKYGTHKPAASNPNSQSVSFAQAQQRPNRPRGGKRSKGGKNNQWNGPRQNNGYQQGQGNPGTNRMAKAFLDLAQMLGANTNTSYGGYNNHQQPQGGRGGGGRGRGRGGGQYQGGRGGGFGRGGRGGGGRGRGRGRSHAAYVVEEADAPHPPQVPHPLTLPYNAGGEDADE